MQDMQSKIAPRGRPDPTRPPAVPATVQGQAHPTAPLPVVASEPRAGNVYRSGMGDLRLLTELVNRPLFSVLECRRLSWTPRQRAGEIPCPVVLAGAGERDGVVAAGAGRIDAEQRREVGLPVFHRRR